MLVDTLWRFEWQVPQAVTLGQKVDSETYAVQQKLTNVIFDGKPFRCGHRLRPARPCQRMVRMVKENLGIFFLTESLQYSSPSTQRCPCGQAGGPQTWQGYSPA